ncbi:MAG: helix-turn-helix transcriptional regulator [Pseudomonadota bacterium]|nr:helix-turn-helix transcriptional regulator [Pseudomonadota bacterium]MEE2870116.1 helix-turn-helix transcriptional regulator [Pseudomonadota bacterium]
MKLVSSPPQDYRSEEASLTPQQLQAYNRLVGTLYACLHDSQGFQPFFDAFQAHFNALQGGILGVSDNPQRLVYGWTFGYPEGFEQWYINSDLPERDEALTRFRHLPPRQFDSFLRGDESKTILDMLNPESRAWAEAVGMGDSAGMLVTRQADTNVVFMANRHKDFGPYSELEILQMNLLAPHIENAITLHFKLYQSSSDNESLAMALDHVNKPMIVFNALATIAQANQAARTLIDNSQSLQISASHRLTSSDDKLSRQLADAITTNLVNANQGRADTQTLFVENRDERIAICLTPLQSERAEHNGLLAELFNYRIDMTPDLGKLQSLFLCTPAEAAIAAELVHGLGATEIADKNGISVHTARQHIKNLLSKNGYRKQTELVAMLVKTLS